MFLCKLVMCVYVSVSACMLVCVYHDSESEQGGNHHQSACASVRV